MSCRLLPITEVLSECMVALWLERCTEDAGCEAVSSVTWHANRTPFVYWAGDSCIGVASAFQSEQQ
jgi:hypothetical protein